MRIQNVVLEFGSLFESYLDDEYKSIKTLSEKTLQVYRLKQRMFGTLDFEGGKLIYLFDSKLNFYYRYDVTIPGFVYTNTTLDKF